MRLPPRLCFYFFLMCPFVAQGQDTPPVVGVDASASVDQFTIVFDAAISRFETAAFAEAADHFLKLQKMRHDFGWENLPQLSFELIRRIDHFLEIGDTGRARFLLNNALELSPTDVRIALAALRYPRLTSWDQYGNLVLELFQHGKQQPLVLVAMLSNILMLSLVSATLALFVVLLIQMLRHFVALHTSIEQSPYLPGTRSRMGMLIAASLLVLSFGLLPALACWSLILAAVARPCRWFATITGALILGWGLSVPLLDTLNAHIRSPYQQAFENLNNSTFVRGDRDLILNASAKQPLDIWLQFATAQMYLHDRQYVAARETLQKVIVMPGVTEVIAQAGLVNLGVCEFMLNNLSQARDYFERAEQWVERTGDSGFELYFNRAQLEMVMVNTESYRDYYSRAVSADFQRLKGLGEIGKESPFLMPARLPLEFLYRALIVPTQEFELQSPTANRTDEFFKHLMWFGSFGTIIVLGMLTSCVGVYLRFRPQKRRRNSLLQFEPEYKRSRVWAFIPGGYYVAGHWPVRGWAYMTLLGFATLAALGSPVKFNTIVSDYMFRTSTLLECAGALFVYVTVLSLWKHSSEAHDNPAAQTHADRMGSL